MRLATLALIALVLAALVLPTLVLAQTTTIEKRPLQADVQRGIVVWTGNRALFKSAAQASVWLTTYVGPDDVQVMKRWRAVYVVIRITSVNYYGQAAPSIRLVIFAPTMGGNVIWSSDWITVSNPGIYEVPIPSYVLQQLDNGFRLGIQLWPFANTGQNAVDHFYGVNIAQVVLAPPRNVDANAASRLPLAAVNGFGVTTALLIIIAALLITLIILVARGGRR